MSKEIAVKSERPFLSRTFRTLYLWRPQKLGISFMFNRDFSKFLLCILDNGEKFMEIIAKHLIFFFFYCKEKRIAYQKANFGLF